MECGFYDLQYVGFEGIVTSGGENFCLAMDRSSSKIFVRIRGALPVNYSNSPELSTTSCNDIAIYGGRIYVNGAVCSGTYAATDPLASDNGEIRLFMMEGRRAKCRIHYCRLYGDDGRTACLRDLRPAVRLADGKNGMYDFQNGGFYVNDGSGADLIAGVRDERSGASVRSDARLLGCRQVGRGDRALHSMIRRWGLSQQELG